MGRSLLGMGRSLLGMGRSLLGRYLCLLCLARRGEEHTSLLLCSSASLLGYLCLGLFGQTSGSLSQCQAYLLQ